MVTSSPSRPIGSRPANTIATTPVTALASHGVRNLGCTELKIGGSRPSFDMV